MEYDVSILQLERVLNGVDYKDVENGANALRPIILKYPDKTSTLIYYMALCLNESRLDDFKNDSKLGSLMSNASVIDCQWFIKSVWNLGLQNFLYEIVEYGPLGISNLIFPCVIDLLKSDIKLLEDNVFYIICSFYKKIIYLNATKNMSSHFEFYAPKLTDLMTTCIIVNMESSVEHELRTSGSLAIGFLNMLESCINKIYEYESFDEEKVQFYKLDGEYVEEATFFEEFPKSEDILKYFLLNLENILSPISCDIWMKWAELEKDSSTIQEIIGNYIFNINEKLTFKKHYMSDKLQECLKQVQIKPKTEEDEILIASMNEIANRIRTNRCIDIKKWYSALIKFDDVWRSRDMMNLLLDQINHACTPLEVMKKVLEFLSKGQQEIELRGAFLRVFKTLTLIDQKELLSEICVKQYIQTFSCNNIEENIIITFNKFSTDTTYEDLTRELIVLFVQRPLKVMISVFQLAIISIENHNLCVYVISELQCVWKLNLIGTSSDLTSEFPFLSLLLENLEFDKIDEKGYKNLASLFNILSKNCSTTFPVTSLIHCLAMMLDTNLEIENWKMCRYLLILIKATSLNAVEEKIKIILLASMAQVCSISSWDVESFSKEKVELNKISCEVMSEIIHTTSLKDCNWLRNIVNRVEKTAKTHFCTIWLDHNLKFPDDEKFYMKLLLAIRSNNVYPVKLEDGLANENQQKLTTWLSFQHLKIIPIIHKDEWFLLYNKCIDLLKEKKFSSPHLTAFEIFSKSMTLLGIHCDNLKTYSCFEFCMGSFSEIFNFILPQLPTNDFIEVFNFLLKPLKTITCSVVKDNCFYLVLPILIKSVKNYLEKNLKLIDNNSLLPFVADMEENWKTDFLPSFDVKMSN